jgi:hypothetical protein
VVVVYHLLYMQYLLVVILAGGKGTAGNQHTYFNFDVIRSTGNFRRQYH